MSCNPENWTIEDLLKMQVDGVSPVSGKDITFSPEFRVSIQRITEYGVHFIIHANGHNSPTLDLIANGNKLSELSKDVKYDHIAERYIVIESEKELIDVFGNPESTDKPWVRRVEE